MKEVAAADGSPVGFYALLPAGDEPAVIHRALPAGASVLELGAGAGRVTHALLALGHPVTAVDQSAAMLAHVHGAETVHTDIEALDLGRRFDGVLLASHLVNTPDGARRAAFLATCRRHVSANGLVLIERLDPRWAVSVAESTIEQFGMRFTIRDIRHDGELFSATMVYEAGDRRWTHAFTAHVLDDEAIVAALDGAGLVPRRWLDAERRWLAAGVGVKGEA